MNPLIQSFLFVATVALLAWPVGRWLMWTVKSGRFDPTLVKLLGTGITRPTGWKTYFLHLLGFNAAIW